MTYNTRSGPLFTNRRLLCQIAAAFMLFIVASPMHGVGKDITVTTWVTVDHRAALDEIPLNSLVTEPGNALSAVYTLRWVKDTTSWLPSWRLELLSAPGMLAPAAADAPESDESAISLANIIPAPGHTYEVTLSYAPALGALAVKVFDQTDERLLYADGMAVATYEGELHGLQGDSQPYFVPVGVAWNPGVGEKGERFLSLRLFETRTDKAAVRFVSPLPVPPGEFRLILEHNGTEHQLGTMQLTAAETYYPLPLNVFPTGLSTLRVQYAHHGHVLLDESVQITVGRIDFGMLPVAIEREHGTLRSAFRIHAAERMEGDVQIALHADIYQLVWDGHRRAFDEVLHATQIPVYDGPVDLSTGSTELPFQVDLPERAGNWRLRVMPAIDLGVSSHVQGNDRLFSTHASAQIEPGDPYTIVVFPDTQFFVQDYPHIYTRMTDWVSAHANELNIAAVLHVGDITNNNTPVHWERAFESMSLLHDVVPYVLTLGNHDMRHGNGPGGTVVKERGYTLINNYFTAADAQRYSNLAGTMVPDRLENHYSLLSIGNTDYLIIALEFAPPDEAIAWANDVATQYPNHKMILLTHAYTATSGNPGRGAANHDLAFNSKTTVNTGVDMWNKLVRRHENSFMVISGHVSAPSTIPHRVAWNDHGRPVYEMLFDYQNQAYGGNGWFGLLTFHPDDTMEVQIYSPFLGEFAHAQDAHGHTSHLKIHLDTGIVQRLHEMKP